MQTVKLIVLTAMLAGASVYGAAQANGPALIAYPGGALPGLSPELFAPGPAFQASGAWWWMSSPVFSPAGTEFYFCKYLPNGPHEVWMSSLENGAWKDPVKARFSTTDFTASPCFSPDGASLYFYAEGRPGGQIFRMRREGKSWSAPEPCAIPLPAGKILGQAFHVAANGNLYLSVLNGALGGTREWASAKLCVSRPANGAYTLPSELPGAINSGFASEVVSWVAPDESYLFFSSSRKGGRGEHDIYISVRGRDGGWGPAEPIGFLNSYQEDTWLSLSPDGAVAFFTTASRTGRGYAAYWFDAKALDSVLPKRR
jgi:hypothetical protein